MSNQISLEVSARICQHMNADHADAVVLYVQAFGGMEKATAAEMVSIDSQGMELKAQVNGVTMPVQIQFDHVLANAEDAHHTLIELVRQARSRH